MKNFLILACVPFILLCSCKGGSKDNRGYIVNVGDSAPKIEVALPQSESTLTLEDLKGKVVMLQFTASWCKVCIEEMPHIESQIWQPLKDNADFALYGVMYKQGIEEANNIRSLTNITYPLALDAEGLAFHSFAEQGAGVTRNVILDKEGKIAYMTRLYNEEEFNEMVKVIHKLLEN